MLHYLVAVALLAWEIATTDQAHAASYLVYVGVVALTLVAMAEAGRRLRPPRYAAVVGWGVMALALLLTGCLKGPAGEGFFDAADWRGSLVTASDAPTATVAASTSVATLTERQRAAVAAVEELFMERGLLTDDKWHDPPPGELKSSGWRAWLDAHHAGGYAAWTRSNGWVAVNHVTSAWVGRQAAYSDLLRPWLGDVRLLYPGDALKNSQLAWGLGTSTACPALPLTQSCGYYMATLDKAANGLHKDCTDLVALAAIDALCGRTPPPPPPEPVTCPDGTCSMTESADGSCPEDCPPVGPPTADACIAALADWEALAAALAEQARTVGRECRP